MSLIEALVASVFILVGMPILAAFMVALILGG